MAEHTTDQIQKALYERSDKATKEDVARVLKPVHDWRGRNGGCKVRVPLSAGMVLARDGKNLRQDDLLVTAQDVKNALGYASVEVTVGTLLAEMEKYMFLHVQPGDRLAYVNQFLADVESTRDAANELAERVQSLENNQ